MEVVALLAIHSNDKIYNEFYNELFLLMHTGAKNYEIQKASEVWLFVYH